MNGGVAVAGFRFYPSPFPFQAHRLPSSHSFTLRRRSVVGAFNELTERMNVLSTSSPRLLFKCLKLSIPILQSSPLAPDGRSLLSRAISVAMLLADLQLSSYYYYHFFFYLQRLMMDAEVISAWILRAVLEAGELSIHEIRNQMGLATAHLLHESLRVNNFPSRIDVVDDDNAAALRKFCLTYQIISMEVMKIHAPLAHAVGTTYLSLELEDLSFQYLFPYSYLYVDFLWLQSHETGGVSLIDIYKEELLQNLKADPLLAELVDDVLIKGRYKSRYSTMKKLLKDGRKPEDVNDIRTTEMDRLAVGGTAAYSLYKAGLTDPEEAKCLKTIILAAAELAALRLKDFLTREDAREMMQLLDSNSNGPLSSDEFHMFQEQVELVRNLEARDDQNNKLLDEKLHMADESGLIQVYNEFVTRLASWVCQAQAIVQRMDDTRETQ
ncbi:putative GTP diphosphokinase CRSH, chloroplastic [Glycine max]|nr:putative GTP diphosphokinase CRSH, chloroplastic [Glycine max]